jgi:CHAD domain-containing protein
LDIDEDGNLAMSSEETIPIDRWLRHLKRYLKVARSGIDPDGVHQVRVATRRIDAWLMLGGWHVFRDDLRWLRQRASAVRDIDALLERPGLPRTLRSPLMNLKHKAQAEFADACDDTRLAALMVGLASIRPIKLSETKKRLHRISEAVVKAGEAAEGNGNDLELLHRLRRALRRLRYGLEFFGASTTTIKRLQETLGNINDLVVALRCIDQLPPDQIPLRYRAELDNELALSLPLAQGLWMDEKDNIRRMVE